MVDYSPWGHRVRQLSTHAHTHIYYIFKFHLSVDRYSNYFLLLAVVDLGCFHVLAIVNSAAMNIGVHVSFSNLVSLGYKGSAFELSMN